MNAKDAIHYTLNLNMSMLKMLVQDLSDADVLARPVPGANHAAWQIGHLIRSEVGLLEGVGVDHKNLLPPGFSEKHGGSNAGSDNPADFLTKEGYLALFDRVRAATVESLNAFADADLDRPTTGPMKDFAPKFGDLYQLIGNHVMMHAGQFTVLRRKLGKPVLF
jgi:hypothetical protein